MERLFSSFKTFNVELFIEEVRNRPTIWDRRWDDYSDKLKRNDCWREVCRSLFPDFDSMEPSKQSATVKELSKKWKNLRQCYKRERDSQHPKSNSAKKKKTQYVYFDVLSFLAPVFNTKTNSSNVSDGEEEEEEKEVEDPSQLQAVGDHGASQSVAVKSSTTKKSSNRKRGTENSAVEVCQVSKQILEDSMAAEKKQEEKDDDETNQSAAANSPTSKKSSSRNRETENTVAEVCQVSKKIFEDRMATEKRQKEKDEEDEDKQFMMSLLSYTRPVKGIHKLNMRSEFLQVVTKYYDMSIHAQTHETPFQPPVLSRFTRAQFSQHPNASFPTLSPRSSSSVPSSPNVQVYQNESSYQSSSLSISHDHHFAPPQANRFKPSVSSPQP